MINDHDLTLLYLAHFRLSAHLSLARGAAAAPSARAHSLRRVSAEALTDAAAARYRAAREQMQREIGELVGLAAGVDRAAAAGALLALQVQLLFLLY